MRSGARPARGAIAWTAVFVGGFTLAALLAPWLYAGLLALDGQLRWPFGRVFNRLAMVIAIAILIAVRRDLGWSRLRALLAADRPGARWTDVGVGFGVAVVGTAAGVAWAFASGELRPSADGYQLLSLRALGTLVGAFVTSLVEEGFFRGLMFPALAAALGAPAGALASSALFSVLHALSADRAFVWSGLEPTAGFVYLGVLAGHQSHPAVLRPLFGLFLVGLALALVVWRSGSLYLAIGLHAGWAASAQMVRHAAWPPVLPPPELPTLARRYFVLGQTWVWVMVVLTAAVALAWAARRRRTRAGGGETGAG